MTIATVIQELEAKITQHIVDAEKKMADAKQLIEAKVQAFESTIDGLESQMRAKANEALTELQGALEKIGALVK